MVINCVKVLKEYYRSVQTTTIMALMLLSTSLFAKSDPRTLGAMASNILGSLEQLAKLITAGSYMAGLGFSIGAIMKFKQHKDNPTQIPIGTPIALVFIAAALLFLPSILEITGTTMFGQDGGTVAGPGGITFGDKTITPPSN